MLAGQDIVPRLIAAILLSCLNAALAHAVDCNSRLLIHLHVAPKEGEGSRSEKRKNRNCGQSQAADRD